MKCLHLRRLFLALCMLTLLAACGRESPTNIHPITATMTKDTAGAPQLKVVLTVDSAAFAMGGAVKDFLKSLVGVDALSQVSSIRFVVNERLVDRYGRESITPTASYEIATSDAKQMNFDGITTFAVLNFARNMTIMHPAARQDIEAFCGSENGKYVQPFCETAREANFTSESTETAR